MKTGLKKSEKTTEIYFDEASPVIEIHTHNTDLKNRLAAYAGRFPDLCKLIDEDTEQGYKEFIIRKGRFCFRLTAPYSEERREKARRSAIENNATDRLKCSYLHDIIIRNIMEKNTFLSLYSMDCRKALYMNLIQADNKHDICHEQCAIHRVLRTEKEKEMIGI